MLYLIDTFRFFNEKCVISCVTRQISQSQVEDLRPSLESVQNTMDRINEFGYYGGTISGDLVINGGLSQIAPFSCIDIVSDPFLFNCSDELFSINNLTPKSGQIWINGGSGNAEIYLDSTGDCQVKFQTFISTGDITLSNVPDSTGNYLLKINSSFGHEYLVEGKRSLSIYGNQAKVNALEVGDGFRTESERKNLDAGFALDSNPIIDSVSVTDYCGVFYEFHKEDWYRFGQDTLFVSWPLNAGTSGDFSSGIFNQVGDSFIPMSGNIDAGKFSLYWKDDSASVSFIKKMIKV